MGAQLSLKAAMPLAEILATCRKNVSNTGPWSVDILYRMLMEHNRRIQYRLCTVSYYNDIRL